MSEEWDDDGWDDPEPIIEVRKINVDITTISQKELLTIEEAMTVCLDRKLEKLNLLLKMMNVYKWVTVYSLMIDITPYWILSKQSRRLVWI